MWWLSLTRWIEDYIKQTQGTNILSEVEQEMRLYTDWKLWSNCDCLGCEGRGMQTTIWISFRWKFWEYYKRILSDDFLNHIYEWLFDWGLMSCSGPTLDVDWRTNTSFASSSTDNMIYVCKIGENHPTQTFAGHQVHAWDLILQYHITHCYFLFFRGVGPIHFCKKLIKVGMVFYRVVDNLGPCLSRPSPGFLRCSTI